MPCSGIARGTLAEARLLLVRSCCTRGSGEGARRGSTCARWDHADPRHQRIAADVLAAARTFAAAYESAAPDGRGAVLDMAADSVDRLADALAGLAEERRRLDEGDARTVAGYLAARYGEGIVPLPRAGEGQPPQAAG